MLPDTSNIEEKAVELLEEHGLSFYFGLQLVNGVGLLLIIPDGIVTPTFVSIYADNIFEALLIAVVSASALVTGNFFLYLVVRLLGTRIIDPEQKQSRTWRLMDWAVNKNAKISLTLFRLSPVGSGLIAIPAGLLKVRTRIFLIYSFIGFLTFETASALFTWYGIQEGLAIEYAEARIQDLT